MQQGDLPLKDSQKGAFFTSATLHFLFLLFLAAQGLFAPSVERISTKIFVQSVALKPGVSQKVLPKKIEPPPQQEIAHSEEPPAQADMPAPKEEKEAPAEEKQAPEQVEDPSPKEEKGTDKPVAAPTKEEAPPQPTTSKKTSKVAKVAPKAKAKAPPKQAPKGKTSSTPKKSSISSAKKSSAPSYDKRLVAEAFSRLDKSAKATKGSGSSQGTSGKGASGRFSHVGSVGALHSDAGISAIGVPGGSDASEFGPTTSEGCYIADLIRRLQLNIRLPEPGEIRIKLTLLKGGDISSVIVVSCRNEKIKSSLLERLKKVHFSAFGQSFPGEKEHTFLLKLSNDLMWSCS